jgi:hypothetical protein
VAFSVRYTDGAVQALPIVYDADCGFCRWSLAWDRARGVVPAANR